MKTLHYETKLDSRVALRYVIFAAAELTRNRPKNIASANQSFLLHAENYIATGGRQF